MKDIMEYFHHLAIIDIKSISGAILGAVLQYLFGKGSGARVLMLIMLSTLFMSLFILQPAMDYFEIKQSSSLRVIVLSLSALISVELISFLIMILPKQARKRILESLGIAETGKEG